MVLPQCHADGFPHGFTIVAAAVAAGLLSSMAHVVLLLHAWYQQQLSERHDRGGRGVDTSSR